MTTGWPPGLLQDDDRGLSRWLASRPDARYQLRKNMTIQQTGSVSDLPEPLRLAESISQMDTFTEHQRGEILKAAAELRRLYALNQELLVALKGAANYIDTLGGVGTTYRQLIARAEGRA